MKINKFDLYNTGDYGNFTKGPRPKAEVDLANVEFRDGVNARLSEILYAGAEKQRGY